MDNQYKLIEALQEKYYNDNSTILTWNNIKKTFKKVKKLGEFGKLNELTQTELKLMKTSL